MRNFPTKGTKGRAVLGRRDGNEELLTYCGPGVVAFSDDVRRAQTRVIASNCQACQAVVLGPGPGLSGYSPYAHHPLSVRVEKLQVPRRKMP